MMRLSPSGLVSQGHEGDQRCLNSELWHACAGPLVSLPAIGSRVVYFPQGHSEQVAASTNKEIDAQIPNYPSLPPQLICQLHNVTMHADVETDEVYAQMTLQPLSPQEQKDPYLPAELGTPNKQPTNYFCKTLTASDTSTHGGFSVPRRAAEKVFPPLDFTQQPPCQELIARDLHGNEWKFRHIFRGQPKRHLLTTGWSVFVSAKRLATGDSVLFIWNENNQLLLGIRRANRPQTVMPSSVLSSDSMHIGLLAAAAHAATTNSRFTIFYNPRASPSEFVIPLAKYAKAAYHTRISVGMRFRMLFETEESSVRRYMGTITGIADLDPVRWPNSHWRSVKVGWDESTAGERQPRVSLWEIEPLTTFPMYPSPFALRLKRPWPSGLPFMHGGKVDDVSLNPQMWLVDGDRGIPSMNFNGLGMTPWMQPRFDASMLGLQPDMYQALTAAAFQEMRAVDPRKTSSPEIVHFQQPQNINGSLQTNHIQHQLQPQSQCAALQESQIQNHNQSQFTQQRLQHCHSYGDRQQPMQSPQSQPQQLLQLQHQQHQQLQHHHHQAAEQFSNHQGIPNTMSSLSELTDSQSQSTPLNTITSFSHQNFPDTNVNPVSTSALSSLHCILGSYSHEESSNLLSFPRSNPLNNFGARSSKRLAMEPLGTQVDQLCSPRTNISQPSVAQPPFSGRVCGHDQEGSTDPQSHLLFGVNIDSTSLLAHHGMGDDINSTSMPFPVTNFLGTMGTELPLNQAFTSSSGLEESGFMQSPDNLGQENPQNGTFVKVYKSGSFGRSLDISKFNSYPELRNELGKLFGLEGQLEDPKRSGWQLVFVDREDDVLLVGDDPWQEFVNNVWCIKILSPQQVLQMGKEGVDLQQNSMNLSSGITSGVDLQQNSMNLSSGFTSGQQNSSNGFTSAQQNSMNLSNLSSGFTSGQQNSMNLSSSLTSGQQNSMNLSSGLTSGQQNSMNLGSGLTSVVGMLDY